MTINPTFPLHRYAEVAWQTADTDIASNAMTAGDAFNTTVDLSRLDCPNINISNIPAAYRDLLVEKFDLRDYDPSSVSLDVRPRIEGTGHPLCGLVLSSSRQYIIFDTSFGIIKSLVSGIASALVQSAGWTPLHAACISIEGRTALLVGGSQAGKSTLVFELAAQCVRTSRQFAILTDDWVVVRQDLHQIEVKSFDATLSIDRVVAAKFETSLVLPDAVLRDVVERGRKHSAPAESTLRGASSFSRAQVDAIFALYPFEGTNPPEQMMPSDFAESAVACSYHYPYATQSEIQSHIARWEEIGARLRPVLVPTRTKARTAQQCAEWMISALAD
jgi:hypothetical protein